ncbi:sulfoxide reductase heme-binding subunit YedZ [Litorilinea aerophila]|uniref:Protein-methionine-sulfoxide reductase heme-binding subunit MsrQ n=1 Tax=Litorilinea aerophila TaxID=1204385 RepID=A0A540VGU9_9CHLR|nr:protein-methionine-sulfoxide reductase heme-binding subunit MsrQ [Litorilinea aerophila]MCC9076874.1 sulfoxide reductase heme-binding subunit YedZ [Litorilinea aerophila]GIV78447.1 MAG: hypothetical protein KatS3mg050_2841 [Litorilinea sp.]
METLRRTLLRHWLWLAVNLGALWPLAQLLWDVWAGRLSVNPIADLTTRTGQAAIILLLLTLAVTPLQILGWRQVTVVRKSLGLWAFFYASVHLLIFVGLDYGFNLDFILRDGLPQKPYIVAGLAAFLILVPLALTSTRGWMKRLGRRWKQLHRWIYLAAGLAVVHYLWVAKIDLGRPALYAVLLLLLLAVRVPGIRRVLANRRRRRPALHAGSSATRPHPRDARKPVR